MLSTPPTLPNLIKCPKMRILFIIAFWLGKEHSACSPLLHTRRPWLFFVLSKRQTHGQFVTISIGDSQNVKNYARKSINRIFFVLEIQKQWNKLFGHLCGVALINIMYERYTHAQRAAWEVERVCVYVRVRV